MTEEKKPLKGLFRDDPETPEGKYLVKRRDGTVVEWPSFVLGARDRNGSPALAFYALLNLLPEEARDELVRDINRRIEEGLADPDGRNKEFVASVIQHAAMWSEYRLRHGDGDPLMGRHRKDDPATVAEMRKGMSA